MAKQSKKPKAEGKTIRKNEFDRLKKDLASDNAATMFAGDFVGLPHKIVHLERVGGQYNLSKKLAIRCGSCENDFLQEANIAPIEVEAACPQCREIHILRFTPAHRVFAVNSETAEIKDEKSG